MGRHYDGIDFVRAWQSIGLAMAMAKPIDGFGTNCAATPPGSQWLSSEVASEPNVPFSASFACGPKRGA